MSEVFGLIGSVAFALSAFPQAIKCWRTGRARDVSAGMLALWLVGELAMIAYTILELRSDGFLLANYLTNLVGLAIIIWFKGFPK